MMNKKKFEFSKIVLALVITSYFIGLVFGMIVILNILDSESVPYMSTCLCGLFSYIATPVAVAIGFYSSKAKAENIEKIKQNQEQPYYYNSEQEFDYNYEEEIYDNPEIPLY